MSTTTASRTTGGRAPGVPGPGRWRHPLLRRVGARVGGAVLVLWASATVTFFALRAVPGDPVIAILGGPGANPTPETIAAVTREYGLDQPLVVQYLQYLLHLVRGDLGTSYSQHRSVVAVIADQLPATLQLTAASLALAWVLALVSALLTVRRRRLVSALGSGLEILAAALPQFWLGILLLVVFAFTLGWLPPAGSDGPRYLVLPALTLAVPLAGFLAQVTRESLDDALEQPFVLSARARGMSDTGVRVRHALRHALLPGITLSGWAVGSLFSGAVVVEVVYSRKGLGRSLFQAVEAQDMPLVVGVTLLIALVYVLVNLAVDVLHRVVDPRLQEAS